MAETKKQAAPSLAAIQQLLSGGKPSPGGYDGGGINPGGAKPNAPKMPMPPLPSGPMRSPLAPISAQPSAAPTLPAMPSLSLPEGTPGFFDALKPKEKEVASITQPDAGIPPWKIPETDPFEGSQPGGGVGPGMGRGPSSGADDFRRRTPSTREIPDAPEWLTGRNLPSADSINPAGRPGVTIPDAHIVPPDQLPPVMKSGMSLADVSRLAVKPSALPSQTIRTGASVPQTRMLPPQLLPPRY